MLGRSIGMAPPGCSDECTAAALDGSPGPRLQVLGGSRNGAEHTDGGTLASVRDFGWTCTTFSLAQV